MTTLTLTIDHLGALGDGVAQTAAGRLHIPLTAPGDVALVTTRGKDQAALAEVLSAGPARVPPPCRHFGHCGGCSLQHLESSFVADWKRAKVATALRRAGVVAQAIAPTVSIAPRTRRRAMLAAKRTGPRVMLGFNERAAHRLVDIQECWVLRPELVAVISPLRDRLINFLRHEETADVALMATRSGVDLLLIRSRALDLADRELLARLAEELDLARIAWAPKPGGDSEPVSVRRTPVIGIGETRVAPPPGCFLQPSDEGQAELIRLVMDALTAIGGPICDLFCGVGTFALPATTFAAVNAYDSEGAAIATLHGARVRGLTPRLRDLFREPLTPTELAPFQAVILDPPRAGALTQAKMLSQSDLPLIIYVSCSPTSFARDAAILAEGGYGLINVTPVDQFLWSPHIELVGVFKRGGRPSPNA